MDPRDHPPESPLRSGRVHASLLEEPEAVKAELLAAVRAYLGDDYDVETHFTPTYRPWRQRIAFIPDGDLFRAIRSGKASVVTDAIDRFTPAGVLTRCGKLIEADIVVTATGFHLNVLGDIDVAIDGAPLDLSETVTYRGMMFTGVPNLAWVFGYFRSSWTLRVDLVADFVCRLLNHMKARGAQAVVPTLREDDATCRFALGRPRGFQSRLPHARHGHPAETRRQARMAPFARLLGRQGTVPEDRPRQRDTRLPLTPAVWPRPPQGRADARATLVGTWERAPRRRGRTEGVRACQRLLWPPSQ